MVETELLNLNTVRDLRTPWWLSGGLQGLKTGSSNLVNIYIIHMEHNKLSTLSYE